MVGGKKGRAGGASDADEEESACEEHPGTLTSMANLAFTL
jgi:hypothetical protein